MRRSKEFPAAAVLVGVLSMCVSSVNAQSNPPDTERLNSQMQKAAEKLGLPMALEGFPDRRYDDDGNLASRSIPGTVLKDPKAAAEQAIRMVGDGEIVAMSGKRLKVKVHTLCVHGDEATGVVVARGIRKALEDADISVVPLPDMKL